jgi:AcrR family transcriptional regulator
MWVARVPDTRPKGALTRNSARERILEAAYDLFSRQGIRAVGIDAIIERAGVARMSLYNHFGSKDELVLVFLQLREERWTQQWLMREIERRGGPPRARLLGLFDLLDEWFQRPDYEGCAYIKVLLETPDPEDAAHRASANYLGKIRDFIAMLARDANVADPEELACQWQILMKGSIVSALEGDRSAARSARKVAEVLLEHRVTQTTPAQGSRLR